MSAPSQWFKPLGSAGTDGYDVAIGAHLPGWEHTGLLVVTLAPGEARQVSTGRGEYVVVPLAGALLVEVTDSLGMQHRADLAGRESVFAGPTDVAYVPPGSTLRITSTEGGRVALPSALAGSGTPRPFRHVGAGEVEVELRGAGECSREVRNFATPGVLDAESVIACEVLTPAGNWSSYPPHKHDEQRAGQESELEEIYHFELQAETRGGPTGGAAPRAFGYQRVYGTAERPIDILAEVRSGDVVLVPHGWHGPAMAPPGYDMHYLNVMAGPGPERAWLICDDPEHAWVRQRWQDQRVDARLPFGGGQ
ncbi:MAG: 5-deoxy-glucuronate isomerase [Lapillicoccus sp.]